MPRRRIAPRPLARMLSAALFLLTMCTSSIAIADGLPPRVNLELPRFDPTPRLLGYDLVVPDPDYVWSTGEDAYVGVPHDGRDPWVWGGVDESGVPWRASMVLPEDTHRLPLPVQVIAVSRSLAVLYFGSIVVIRDGRASFHTGPVVSATFAHLASPAGRVLVMSGMPQEVFVLEPEGTSAVIPVDAPRESPTPAFVGETWALAYETPHGVDVVPSVGPAFSFPLRDDPPRCTSDERPDVRVVLNRWIARSFVDFTIDWRGGETCVRRVAIDSNAEGRPIRTVRYGAHAPVARVARRATVEVSVSVGAMNGADDAPRMGLDHRRTIQSPSLVAVDRVTQDVRVVVPRQRITADLFRIDPLGQVSEIARPSSARCGVPECRWWPAEIEPTFIRWGALTFPFTETGLGAPARVRATNVADVAMFPEGLAWLGTSSRSGATLEYPRGTRADSGLGSGRVEPIGLAGDAHGSRLVVGDSNVRYVESAGCWGPDREATRVVLVRAADGTTTRMGPSDAPALEGDILTTSGESQMGLLATIREEMHVFVSDLGAPLRSLPTVPGTACKPTPIAFAVDPPRVVYLDCAAETLDPFVRTIRFDAGRWVDVIEPYRLSDEPYLSGVDADIGRDAVLAVMRPEHIDLLRERDRHFALLASIPRAR